ncbi:MAG TPA: hypothetical protein VMV27_01970 [Candidatus Binataceae bacterium]|nr:hypothetical protein [Candidatus Binataceae bacterium]
MCKAIPIFSALILSAGIAAGCSPALVEVKGAAACAPPAPFAFASPVPAPDLPAVSGTQCPGYALCLDQVDRDAMFDGIRALENDTLYMRDFYRGQINAYQAELKKQR